MGAVKGESYDAEALEVAANGSPVWDFFSEVYFEPKRLPYKPLFGKEFFSPSEPVGSWPEYVRKLPPGVLEIHPVDKHVLLVAAERPGHTWRAYIGAVEGKDYFKEAPEVVTKGSEVPFELAWVCFRDLGKGTELRGDEWYIPPPTREEIELARKRMKQASSKIDESKSEELSDASL